MLSLAHLLATVGDAIGGKCRLEESLQICPGIKAFFLFSPLEITAFKHLSDIISKGLIVCNTVFPFPAKSHSFWLTFAKAFQVRYSQPDPRPLTHNGDWMGMVVFSEKLRTQQVQLRAWKAWSFQPWYVGIQMEFFYPYQRKHKCIIIELSVIPLLSKIKINIDN